jgi:hypothetical protein
MVFDTVDRLSSIRKTTKYITDNALNSATVVLTYEKTRDAVGSLFTNTVSTTKYVADSALNSASAIISDGTYRDAVSSYFPTNLVLSMANTGYQAFAFVSSSKVLFCGAVAAVGTFGIYQTYSYLYDTMYTPRSNGPSEMF